MAEGASALRPNRSGAPNQTTVQNWRCYIPGVRASGKEPYGGSGVKRGDRPPPDWLAPSDARFTTPRDMAALRRRCVTTMGLVARHFRGYRDSIAAGGERTPPFGNPAIRPPANQGDTPIGFPGTCVLFGIPARRIPGRNSARRRQRAHPPPRRHQAPATIGGKHDPAARPSYWRIAGVRIHLYQKRGFGMRARRQVLKIED